MRVYASFRWCRKCQSRNHTCTLAQREGVPQYSCGKLRLRPSRVVTKHPYQYSTILEASYPLGLQTREHQSRLPELAAELGRFPARYGSLYQLAKLRS